MSVVVIVVYSSQLDVSSLVLELVKVTSVKVRVMLDTGVMLDLSTSDVGDTVASEPL